MTVWAKYSLLGCLDHWDHIINKIKSNHQILDGMK